MAWGVYPAQVVSEPEPRKGPEPEAPPSSLREMSRAGLVLGLAALVLAALWWSGYAAGDGVLGFRLDDAWIHMVYGREIAARGYPAYNPGIPATGSTAPLWCYGLGLLHVLVGPDRVPLLVAASLATNVMLWLAAVWLGMSVARALSASSAVVVQAGLCLAFSTPLAAAAFSGMEIVLGAVLLLAGAHALLRERPGRAGLAFALACLTRPESAVCCLLAAIGLLVLPTRDGPAGHSARPRLRALLTFATPLFVLGAAALIFNLAVSGRALPATFYMKVNAHALSLPERLHRLFVDLLPQVPMFGGLVIWLASLAFVLARSWPARLRALLLFLMGLGYAAANVLLIPPVDPVAFYHLRYVLPAAPLLVVALFVASSRVVPSRYPRLARTVPPVICAATAIAGALSIPAVSRHLHSDTRNINQVQRRLGEWVSAHVPPNAWIATNDAGAVRYFSRRPALDMMGLNTPQLFWEPDTYARQHPIHVAVLMPAWFGVADADADAMRILARASTHDYTVTSDAKMGLQWVLGYGKASPEPVPVAFVGTKQLKLYMFPAHHQVQSGQPAIDFDKRVHDFGLVNEGDPLKHVFQVKNRGEAPLVLSEVRTSCGCAAANLADSTLPPGGSGPLEVTIDTHGEHGQGSRSITVFSNDPHQPTSTLEIRYDVERLLDLDRSFVQLTTTQGSERVERVWLTGDRVKQARLRVAKIEDGKLVTVRVIVRRERGELRKGLELKLNGRQPASGDGTLTLKTGLSIPPELSLPFRYEVN